MEKDKKNQKKSVQLEFIFNSEEKSIVSVDHKPCFIEKKMNFGKIININEGFKTINDKKQNEILNYILNNSRSF